MKYFTLLSLVGSCWAATNLLSESQMSSANSLFIRGLGQQLYVDRGPALIEQLQQDKVRQDSCAASLEGASQECETCVKGCDADVGDLILDKLDQAANFADDTVNDVIGWKGWGDFSNVFTNDVANWASDAGNDIGEFAGDALNGLGNFAEDVGDWFGGAGDLFSDFGNSIGNGLDSAADWTVGAAKDVGKFFGGLFGKRGAGVNALRRRYARAIRRYLAKPKRDIFLGGFPHLQHLKLTARGTHVRAMTRVERACMEKCPVCMNFEDGTTSGASMKICGFDIEADAAASAKLYNNLKTLDGIVKGTLTPALTGITYESYDPLTGTFTGLKVTAYTPEGLRTYSTNVQYDTFNPKLSIYNMGIENFLLWLL